VTCFSWSPCGTKLAIGNSKGDLKILNLTSEDKLHEFNNLSANKITSVCFVDSEVVASVDSKSNLTVTHIEKNIARLNFHSSEIFSKLTSPIKQISHVAHPNQTSICSLLYLISESSLAVFNYQTAAISKKVHSLVSVQDPEDISFTTIGTEIVVKCDKLTLLAYSASKKTEIITFCQLLHRFERKKEVSN
jgi:predicted nucleic acid-binding protein